MMKACSDKFCPLHHIAIDVADLEGTLAFFQEVFGMTVIRKRGPDERPDAVWLDGGVQLDRVEDAGPENGRNGRFSHIAFQTTDVPAVLERAKAFGAAPVPEKEPHWFMLPNGLRFEMME